MSGVGSPGRHSNRRRRSRGDGGPASHGIVLVDKPAGATSNHTTRAVQRLFGAAAAGHLGTLDPFATGLLPVMLGDATRLARWLETGTKAYVVDVALGTTTDTLDRDGAIVERRAVPADVRERLAAALPRFVGTVRQRVPDYSAAKVRGVRRCDLARAGETPAPTEKDVVVHDLRILKWSEIPDDTDSPLQVSLEVTCGPGTYVRQLVADLGEALGCGAHAAALRRTAVGAFRVDEAVTPETIEAAVEGERGGLLVDLSDRLPGPLWEADEPTWTQLAAGGRVPFPGEAGEGAVAFVAFGGRLRAVGEVVGAELQPRRVLSHGLAVRGCGSGIRSHAG